MIARGAALRAVSGLVCLLSFSGPDAVWGAPAGKGRVWHPVLNEATHRLLQDLAADGDAVDRAHALDAWAAIASADDEAPVRRLLSDPAPAVRMAAVRAAAALGLALSPGEQEQLAEDGCPGVRAEFFRRLDAFRGVPAELWGRRGLQDKSPAVRAAAVVGQGGAPWFDEAIDREEDGWVRLVWLQSLMAHPGGRREEILAWAFRQPEPALRAEALAALSTGDERHADRVRELLDAPEAMLAEAAAAAVGSLGDPDLVPDALRQLRIAGDVQRLLLCRSLGALGARAGQAAASALAEEAASATWDRVRQAAVEALLAMETPESIGYLVELVSSEEAATRARSAEMLGRLGRPEYAPVLLSFFEEEDPGTAQAGLQALRRLGAPGIAPYRETLRAWRDHDHPELAAESIRLLGLLHDTESIPAVRARLERIRYDQPHAPRVAAFEFLTALEDRHLLSRAVAIASRPVVLPPPGGEIEYDHDDVRSAAIVHLGQLGDARRARSLLGAFEHAPGLALRHVLADAVGRMTGVPHRVKPDHRYASYAIESLEPPPELYPEAPGIEPLP